MPEMNDNGTKQTVLVVDDAPTNLALMSSLLNARYKTKVAPGGEKALEVAFSTSPPDLILLDVMMPGMDGYEVCRRLKGNPKTAEIPIIFLTAKSDAADEQKGLELGAVDYIAKPISPAIVAARVRTHLQLKSSKDFLKDKSEYLEQEVQRRTHEISIVQAVTMVAMGSLAETRDNETGNHIRRTQHYVKMLADRLKDHPKFSAALTPGTIQLLYMSAPLHDIGKVGIPDRILLKPGKLTAEEFEIMKTHTTIGRNSIMAAEKLIESSSSFLSLAREIAWSHHEKWDGTGYPQGLSGEAITMPGRLMAVVDVYDALVSKRVYKPAFPHSTAVSMIKEGSGSHFDPDIVDAFIDTSDQIHEVAQRYLDAEVGQS